MACGYHAAHAHIKRRRLIKNDEHQLKLWSERKKGEKKKRGGKERA
jgi:hypothetical protein